MSFLRFIFCSIAFHRRTHFGVLLGAALASAILIGALSVGDSVRHSIAGLAKARLGSSRIALVSSEHLFSASLADGVASKLGIPTAPVLLLRGTIAAPDGSSRANDIQIVGADHRFWTLGGTSQPALAAVPPGEAAFALNAPLAARLRIQIGDTLVLRMEEPAPLSHDAPLTGVPNTSVALRGRVAAIVDREHFGFFGLRAEQVPPLTVFLPLSVVQTQAKQPGGANVILAGSASPKAEPSLDAFSDAVRSLWSLADANLEVRTLPASAHAPAFQELRSPAVFLNRDIESAARKADPNARGVLTYLVNELRCGERSTPYSMVTATDALPAAASLAPGEILVNSWLANDLAVRPGDTITLRYFVLLERRELAERTASFRVRDILPLDAPDPSWSPEFPGVSDTADCGDWKPGLPIDTGRIRPADEDYWDRFRATPKAFIRLDDGQKIWSNRFGRLTSLRIPESSAAPSADRAAAAAPLPQAQPSASFDSSLLRSLTPVQAGLALHPVYERASLAARDGQDFTGLFIGFSFFLILAALLLTGLLFVFHLEQRAGERALLISLGFSPRQAERWLWAESAVVVGLGSLAGTLGGVLYARLALLGLSSIWSGATQMDRFDFHAKPSTWILGIGISFATGLLATWIAGRTPARSALALQLADRRSTEPPPPMRPGRLARFALPVCLLGALAFVFLRPASAPSFFGAGCLLLIAGLLVARRVLLALAHAQAPAASPTFLGFRTAARRLGRSTTSVALLASGIFLVVSVGAFRQDPRHDASARSSGTGGFSLLGKSSLPIYEDLNTPAGRAAWHLDTPAFQNIAFVQLRARQGDDASCFNLNRAQTPSLLGVDSRAFSSRGSFTFLRLSPDCPSGAGWSVLDTPLPDGTIPAIGDEATLTWGFGKSVGDVFTIEDEHGRPLRLRIVGIIGNSLLQGHLFISDAHFIAHFPKTSGSRVFLIDAPAPSAENARRQLMEVFQDKGMEIVPAVDRLAEFATVANSYIAIFDALGGLGLLLGSLGFGIVTLRNAFERRAELALLQAVGFSPAELRRLLLSEHLLLLALGLVVGGVSAFVSILPALFANTPLQSVLPTVALLLLLAVSAFCWSALAARSALGTDILNALRDE